MQDFSDKTHDRTSFLTFALPDRTYSTESWRASPAARVFAPLNFEARGTIPESRNFLVKVRICWNAGWDEVIMKSSPDRTSTARRGLRIPRRYRNLTLPERWSLSTSPWDLSD